MFFCSSAHLISAANCYILWIGEGFAGSSKGCFVMSVQRSHFRLYLSITLIVVFVLSLAAPGDATRAVERGNLQGWEILSLLLVLIASLFHADWR